MDIKNVYDAIIFTSAALTLKDALIEAVSKKANLCGANLGGADLGGADLCGADLCGANLRGADLHGANLGGANLGGADLHEANLGGADLGGANLCGANLRGVKNADLAFARLQFIPPEGAFIAWKKCLNGVIVKLSIPEDAKRSHSTGRKCRASKALVLDVFGAKFGVSSVKATFEYRKGCEVVSDSWDEDRWNECSHGIHFFLTRLEAEDYDL